MTKVCNCKHCQRKYSIETLQFWGVSAKARGEALKLAPERRPVPRLFPTFAQPGMSLDIDDDGEMIQVD